MKPFRWMRDALSASIRNPLGLAGLVLAGSSAAVILALVLLDLFGFHTNPYAGLLVFLVLPAILVAGLVLVPIGLWRQRRHAGNYPVIDLNVERHRSRFLGFVILGVANLAILGMATYRGVEHMDSVEFCGQTCHSVMRPEYTAYSRSPHARVACVDCHIGPGADWFVKSKLSGVGQIFAVALRTYERPIPVPVKNLRPARETCEQCHWPEKFHGDRIRVLTKYAEDDANTEQKTVMILKVGGGSPDSGFASGIHWHMNIANSVIYVAEDETRQVIPFVRFTDREGRVTDYVADGAAAPDEETIRAAGRTMDCVDCHNRPTHVFRLPDEEVDEALRVGHIPRTLPFAKKASVEVLSRPYASHAEARQAIPAALEAWYRTNQPDVAAAKAEAIRRTAAVLTGIYEVNVFPQMGIGWGTYTSNIGHMNAPGCFRCHDGGHASADGRTISSECENCHTLLAVDEPQPEILERLFPAD
jgi:nitrate/TMAO reductase-like tetraheme cytochrome c subunit